MGWEEGLKAGSDLGDSFLGAMNERKKMQLEDWYKHAAIANDQARIAREGKNAEFDQSMRTMEFNNKAENDIWNRQHGDDTLGEDKRVHDIQNTQFGQTLAETQRAHNLAHGEEMGRQRAHAIDRATDHAGPLGGGAYLTITRLKAQGRDKEAEELARTVGNQAEAQAAAAQDARSKAENGKTPLDPASAAKLKMYEGLPGAISYQGENPEKLLPVLGNVSNEIDKIVMGANGGPGAQAPAPSSYPVFQLDPDFKPTQSSVSIHGPAAPPPPSGAPMGESEFMDLIKKPPAAAQKQEVGSSSASSPLPMRNGKLSLVAKDYTPESFALLQQSAASHGQQVIRQGDTFILVPKGQ